MNDTTQLLNTLIESNRDTSEAVKELTITVNNLVTIDAAKAEREKNQAEKNEKYDNFIYENTEPLLRLRRSQGHWSKTWEKVIALTVISAMTGAGFKFLG